MSNFDQEIEKLLQTYPVILFMKGDKHFPKCGYSRLAVEILNEYQVEYVTFDILQDQEFRDKLKIYSDWPTYPQLYINAELIGGSDIIKELHISGKLEEILK